MADYCGLSYGHDEPDRQRHIGSRHRGSAAVFLQSQSADYLADLIGLRSAVIWTEACRLVEQLRGLGSSGGLAA